MCGRYTLATPADDLVEAFDLPGLTFDYFARFNIAPGTAAPERLVELRQFPDGTVDEVGESVCSSGASLRLGVTTRGAVTSTPELNR